MSSSTSSSSSLSFVKEFINLPNTIEKMSFCKVYPVPICKINRDSVFIPTFVNIVTRVMGLQGEEPLEELFEQLRLEVKSKIHCDTPFKYDRTVFIPMIEIGKSKRCYSINEVETKALFANTPPLPPTLPPTLPIPSSAQQQPSPPPEQQQQHYHQYQYHHHSSTTTTTTISNIEDVSEEFLLCMFQLNYAFELLKGAISSPSTLIVQLFENVRPTYFSSKFVLPSTSITPTHQLSSSSPINFITKREQHLHHFTSLFSLPPPPPPSSSSSSHSRSIHQQHQHQRVDVDNDNDVNDKNKKTTMMKGGSGSSSDSSGSGSGYDNNNIFTSLLSTSSTNYKFLVGSIFIFVMFMIIFEMVRDTISQITKSL